MKALPFDPKAPGDIERAALTKGYTAVENCPTFYCWIIGHDLKESCPGDDELLQMDAEGDTIQGDRHLDISETSPNVRMVIRPDTTRKDAIRLLRKVLTFLETDGLPAGIAQDHALTAHPVLRRRAAIEQTASRRRAERQGRVIRAKARKS